MITIAINEILFWLIVSLLVLLWCGTYIAARGDRFDMRDGDYPWQGTRKTNYPDVLAGALVVVSGIMLFVMLVLVLVEGVRALA